MKKLVMRLFVALSIMGFSGITSAQMVGLPVMDTATAREAGNLEVTPGLMFGKDMDFYGARATVTAMDDLRVFFDLGRVDINNNDANFGVQGGMLYSLEPTDLADLGIRVAAYHVNTDFLGLTGMNGMLVFSDETLLNDLYCYGGAGLDVSYKTYDTSWGEESSQVEINPAFSLGLAYALGKRFTLFTEADYVDGFYFGAGLSIR